MLQARPETTQVPPDIASRRRFPRFPVDVEVKVVREGGDGSSNFYYGRGSEVGEGGMAVFVAREFSLGEVVRVIAKFPYASRPLECSAIVRNRSSYCYGIEFLGLGLSEREFVARTCHFLSMIQSPA